MKKFINRPPELRMTDVERYRNQTLSVWAGHDDEED
jgi:hypothetical protein